MNIQDINSEIRSPFLHEAEGCIRNNLPYASIVMLGLCGEAYLRRIAMRIHDLDRGLIPYFGQKCGCIDEKRSKKLKESEFERTRLDFKELVEIFISMQLLADNKEDLSNPFDKRHFIRLAEIRNTYAHPNWKDRSKIEEKCHEFIDKLGSVLVHRIEFLRLNTASSLIDYITTGESKSPSSCIELIPHNEISTQAKRVLAEILEPESGDLIEKVRNFWFHLKQQAPNDEKEEIERFFTDRLQKAIDDEDNNRVEILIDLIDWTGSDEFCDKCKSLIVDWLYDKESEMDAFDEGSLRELLSKIDQFKDHFSGIRLFGLEEISGKIQKKLAINDLLATLKQIAQKDKEQTL